MLYRKLIVLLFCLVWYGNALAGIKCDATIYEISGPIETYLKYYKEECINEEINNRLTNYRIKHADGQNPSEEEKVFQMIRAWHEISVNFDKLADEADESSEMKKVYQQLAIRAAVAMKELELAVDLQLIPDISAARNGAWKIDVDLELPEFNSLPDLRINYAMENDCAVRDSLLCANTLKQGRDLMLEWTLADNVSATISDEVILKVSKQVVKKNDMWDKYLYNSKPMYPFDIVFTDWANRGWSESDQYKDGFRIPPKTQWFIFHPSVGLEYVSSADDGEQLEPVLYVEVIGVNRWNDKDRWIDVEVLRYFTGFSLIISYADRAETRDVGYGGLFTFDNVYSVGVTDYSGHTGVFVSVDLANLWREKYKATYEKYKDKF